MERITVNLEVAVARQLKAKADGENRSTSSYVELLIEQDLRAAGLLPSEGRDSAELAAKVIDAVEANPAIKAKIESVIKAGVRASRARA